MRFAIALLCLIAIASIIGTVLKQAEPYSNYIDQFGPFWAYIFNVFGLFNVYSSAWFLTIFAFLIVSTSLCLIRNTPKILADIRQWKDHVHENGLRAFSHKAEWLSSQPKEHLVSDSVELIQKAGYRVCIKDNGATALIAARAGMSNKLGYIFAHLAIIIICLGGLLDSDLTTRLQTLIFQKTPLPFTQAFPENISENHRLSANNLAFRSFAFVPEGNQVGASVINMNDGALIQNLPFLLRLKKFHVGYYSTGMPKLFASDVVLTDRATGEQINATIKVNEPLTYKGITIYQSSFEDGGSQLQLTGFPLGSSGSLASLGKKSLAQALSQPLSQTFSINNKVGDQIQWKAPGTSKPTAYSIELIGFRAINVENIPDKLKQNKPETSATVKKTPEDSFLSSSFSRQMGSGATKLTEQKTLRNVGPSIQYKIRDSNGQAQEYNTYMLPLDMDGDRVFLSGVRKNPGEVFRYIRIPADADDSVKQWMLLREALLNPQYRKEAARRFAASYTGFSNGSHGAASQKSLELSVNKLLDIFSGAEPPGPGLPNSAGFSAIADFMNLSVPKAEQAKAATLLLRILNGGLFQIWQIARENAHQKPMSQETAKETAQKTTQETSARFLVNATNALSDSFLYDAPVYLQLDSFQQKQASVFQLSRMPGKTIVYTGCILLILGIFSMFYIRERRLWLHFRTLSGTTEPQTALIMAMSSTRKTFDFEKEFLKLRDALQKINP